MKKGFITLPILLAVIVALGFALGGGTYWFKHSQNAVPYVPEQEEYTAYTDNTYGFSVVYPHTLIATTSPASKGWDDLAVGNGITIFSDESIRYAKGYVTMSANDSVNALTACLSDSRTQARESRAPTNIDQVNFVRYSYSNYTSTSAAEAEVYRGIRNGICYGIVLVMDGVPVESRLSDDENKQRLSDRKAVYAQLEPIAESFRHYRVLDNFSATPNSGTAPLTVSFEYRDLATDHSIDFGDGSSGTLVNSNPDWECSDTGSCIAPTYIASHTYSSTGAYHVVLSGKQYRGEGYIKDAVLGTTTITVGNNAAVSATGMKTDTTQWGFSIKYPDDLTPRMTESRALEFSLSSDEDSSLINYLDSDSTQFQVGTTISPAIVSECLKLPNRPEQLVSDGGIVQADGVSFRSFKVEDVASSSYTVQQLYRMLHNGSCWTISADFQWTEYLSDASNAKTIHEQREFELKIKISKLDQIVRTFKLTNNSANSVSVPGMSKYTDSENGYSFWYPSEWKVTPEAGTNSWVDIESPGVTNRMVLNVGGKIKLLAVYSSEGSFTDTGGAGPFGPVTYFYDTHTNRWMVVTVKTTSNGFTYATTTASTNLYTMGGLPMFGGTSQFNTKIIPIDPKDILVVSDRGAVNADFLARTVVPLYGSVPAPSSNKDQNAVIQAEKDAYAPAVNDVPSVFQIHITDAGPNKVSKQQESDPIMKKGDRAEISINNSTKVTIALVGVGNQSSYDATFLVSTPSDTKTISNGGFVPISRVPVNGVQTSVIFVKLSAPVSNNSVTAHFNVHYNIGDE